MTNMYMIYTITEFQFYGINNILGLFFFQDVTIFQNNYLVNKLNSTL